MKLQIMFDLHLEMHADRGRELIASADMIAAVFRPGDRGMGGDGLRLYESGRAE